MTARLSPHTSLAFASCLFSSASANPLPQVFTATCFSLYAEKQASGLIFFWLVTVLARALSIAPTAQKLSNHMGLFTSPTA
jgi:hypothetical protein